MDENQETARNTFVRHHGQWLAVWNLGEPQIVVYHASIAVPARQAIIRHFNEGKIYPGHKSIISTAGDLDDKGLPHKLGIREKGWIGPSSYVFDKLFTWAEDYFHFLDR